MQISDGLIYCRLPLKFPFPHSPPHSDKCWVVIANLTKKNKYNK